MATRVNVYGLASCDTTRVARRWLKERGVAFTLIDVRADGIDRATVERWVAERGWVKVLNKSSSTWRLLDEDDKANITPAKAVKLIVANPTLLKRPVLEAGDILLIGFDADAWDLAISQSDVERA